MGNTFGGEWTRPRSDGRGHSARELQDRASFDNQKNTGCSALFFACLLVVAAVLGVVLG
jgi:hypothetical protein